MSFAGKQGCVPSHASLAAEAGVCERTVRNALREARLRGW
ncbi:helix-turn-helix domain-containing protein [Swingsia samuiensis]|nr:helix-turn-helix domain-containing protein [Swingsia samuiensis]